MLKKILNHQQLPYAILALIVIVVISLYLTKPKAAHRPPAQPNTISVEVLPIKRAPFQAKLHAYGKVAPQVQSHLVAQISGRIEWLSENFRDGGFFKKGSRLIQIEGADYQAEVDIAAANVATAETQLFEQQALAQQAVIDWQRLGEKGQAPDLVLRKPQVKAAQADLKSARAKLRKAHINLQRTVIYAPFDGRVLSKNVDLGQVVNQSSSLGEIYATNAIEIELPLKHRELMLLNLPSDTTQELAPTAVDIYSMDSRNPPWRGSLIRTAGAIDDSSRQLSVFARIDSPHVLQQPNQTPLRIGEYVKATLYGRTIDDAITIPNHSIYQGTYVYLFNNGTIERRDIQIYWQDEELSLLSAGLENDEQLILTPLGQIPSGTPATIQTHTDSNQKTLLQSNNQEAKAGEKL